MIVEIKGTKCSQRYIINLFGLFVVVFFRSVSTYIFAASVHICHLCFQCEQLKLTLKQAEDARRAGSEKAADF